MRNLVEQLLLKATEMNGLHDFQTRDLLTQAADTIEAQDRLLALAGAVADWVESPDSISKTMGLMLGAAQAYEAALTEYQTTGTVPCEKCEATKGALEEWRADFREVEKAWKGAEATIDDLRRRLAEAREQRDEWRKNAETSRDNALLFLKERYQAHVDNAALVKALTAYQQADSQDGMAIAFQMAAEILSQPHPGAALLEELAALRKVAEAARDYDTWRHDPGTTDGHLRRLLGKLSAALTALDAHERKDAIDFARRAQE